MKKFIVGLDIIKACGTQIFEVVAEDEADAIDKVRHATIDALELVDEDIDVQKTGEPYIVDCEER